MRTITLADGKEHEFQEVAVLGDGDECTFGHIVTPWGDRWACIVYETTGIVFTTAEPGGPQPEAPGEIAEHDWYSRAGTAAIMFPADDGLRLPVLPPWALE